MDQELGRYKIVMWGQLWRDKKPDGSHRGNRVSSDRAAGIRRNLQWDTKRVVVIGLVYHHDPATNREGYNEEDPWQVLEIDGWGTRQYWLYNTNGLRGVYDVSTNIIYLTGHTKHDPVVNQDEVLTGYELPKREAELLVAQLEGAAMITRPAQLTQYQ